MANSNALSQRKWKKRLPNLSQTDYNTYAKKVFNLSQPISRYGLEIRILLKNIKTLQGLVGVILRVNISFCFMFLDAALMPSLK